MEKDLPPKPVVISVFLFCSLLISIPAHGTNDLNSQIDILTQELASAAQGEVLKGSETEVYISLGQRQGILPGNKFEIVRQGEPLQIGDEIIGYEETKVAEVEVEKARDKLSICRVLEKSGLPQNGDKAYQLRKKINTLVVGQFSYNQGFNRLTKNLQEKLVTAMTNRGMKVVERDQLERVLKEQKLGYSGLVNMNSAKKIGELLGAEGMLLGTVSDMGNAININARMVDIESGKAVSASEVELAKTPIIAQLLGTAIQSEPKISQPESSQEPAGTQAQHFDNIFKNDFLRVEPKAVHISEDKKRVSVSLSFRNISKEKIWLSLQQKSSRKPMVTLDTYQGDALFPKAFNGFPLVHINNAVVLSQYSALGGGSQTVLICSFTSKKPIKSNIFSISAGMLKHSGKGKEYARFSVGLHNIKIK